MRTAIPLALAAWLVALCPCWAGEQDRRFLELDNIRDTTVYDLRTVHTILPGKFSIVSTTIDDPVGMERKLKWLRALARYCTRRDGKYPAPAGMLRPDGAEAPPPTIEVQAHKYVVWHPAPGAMVDSMLVFCGARDRSEQENEIRNGHTWRELFDCTRGLSGTFYDASDHGDPSKVNTHAVPPNTLSEVHYLRVCHAVMHEWPFMPERPASAQVELGNTFDSFKEYAEAAKWYRKAASQGDAKGQVNLAAALEWGKGVKKDYAEAAKLYRLAADQGDGEGQLSLGIMYYSGNGVPQDRAQAYKWFTLALARFPASGIEAMQHDNCIEWRDKVAAGMTLAQITEAHRQVAQWRTAGSGK